MLEDHYRTALVRILRKKQAKRPGSSGFGEAFSGERRQLDGCAPPQHRRRKASGRKVRIPAKRRKTRGQAGSALRRA